MYCLFCHEELSTMTWHNPFLIPAITKICQSCESKLKRISITTCCQLCSGKMMTHNCIDCLNWDKHYNFARPLVNNRSVFKYNSFLQDIIVQWKYRRDYILAHLFKTTFRHKFNRYFSHVKKYLLIPIPLSDVRLKERGFNQAFQLASFLTPHVNKDILHRVHTEKQAKKSRRERLSGKNPFVCQQKINKPVILIDDIYTTGATIYAAAETLKRKGCPNVYSFTLARG